jgi:DNA topoisomerase II
MEIRFLPDYERFQCTSLKLIERLVHTRAIDIVACTDKTISVYWNDEKLPARTFKEFVARFFSSSKTFAWDAVRNMEVALVPRQALYTPQGVPEGSCTLSRVPPQGVYNHQGVPNGALEATGGVGPLLFVNAMRCCEGKHVDWMYRTIKQAFNQNGLSKKDQEQYKLQISDLKQHFVLVGSLWIPNPEYTSATKEKLRNPPSTYGISWEPSKSFLNSLNQMGLRDILSAKQNAKQNLMLSKALNTPQRRHRMPQVEKHDPALMAGQPGHFNTLILTEGDSAKALAIAGVAVVGRQHYGVFPLRGKFLNVRGVKKIEKVANNNEVANLMKIVGLRLGDRSQKIQDLYYQRILLFCDADDDGAHICALVYNFFHYFFRHLLQENPDFLVRFATPVVKLFPKSGNSKEMAFFSVQDMREYLRNYDESKYKIRFYKGLGTSSNKEAKVYFAHLDDHLMVLRYTQEETDKILDDLFMKQKTQERKTMLETKYNPDVAVDYKESSINFEDYVVREVLHFSWADNVRSIPSVIDGMKPCQRKILWTFLHRNITTDKKVSDAAGEVSSETAYHHGEQSLLSAIVGMAQNHVGTNNINLLVPQGQHGSRINKPSVHAASRYLFTWTSAITKYIFRPEDFPVLEYNYDDGRRIEPVFFVPIVPYILVNGCTGIGTGWSTEIPSYNPQDLVRLTREQIRVSRGELEYDEFRTHVNETSPWIEGFKGRIVKDHDNYLAVGCWDTNLETRTVHITELPPQTWTDPYVAKLQELTTSPSPNQNPLIEDLVSNSTEANIDIAVVCNPGPFEELKNVAQQFFLTTKLSMNNMHAFTKDSKLKRYENILSIFEDFFPVRLDLYEKRKTYTLQKMQEDMKVLQNKVKFILEIVQDTLQIRKMTKQALVEYLSRAGYAPHDEFQYLLGMPYVSCTVDQAEKLQKSYRKLQESYTDLEKTDVRDIWLAELDEMEQRLIQFYAERERDRNSDGTETGCAVKMIRAARTSARKRKRVTLKK